MADVIQKGDNKAVRDEKGKFLPGVVVPGIRPGRPKQTNKASYIAISQDEITEDKWRTIIQKAFEDATSVDSKLRKDGREFLRSVLIPTKIEIDFGKRIEEMNDIELDTYIRQLAGQAGVSLSTSGEEEEIEELLSGCFIEPRSNVLQSLSTNKRYASRDESTGQWDLFCEHAERSFVSFDSLLSTLRSLTSTNKKEGDANV